MRRTATKIAASRRSFLKNTLIGRCNRNLDSAVSRAGRRA